MEDRLLSLKKQRLSSQHPLLVAHDGYITENKEDTAPSHFKMFLKDGLIKSMQLHESKPTDLEPVWRGEVNHPLLQLDTSNHSIYRRKEDLDEFVPRQVLCLELEIVPRSHEELFLQVSLIYLSSYD